MPTFTGKGTEKCKKKVNAEGLACGMMGKTKGKEEHMYYLINGLLSLLIFTGGSYLIFLPPINPQSGGFWLWTIASLAVLSFVEWITFWSFTDTGRKSRKSKGKSKEKNKTAGLVRIPLFLTGFTLLLLVGIGGIGTLSSSKIFHAKAYAEQLNVVEEPFAQVIQPTEEISSIAIMDTDTARIIGKRAVGSIAGLVSQYNVSEEYTQISYQDSPMKVAPLAYDGLIKYLNNKATGIPGYVLVNPVTNTSQYVELEQGIQYAPSAYFSRDLLRHIRSAYPTKILEGHYFEIDDTGAPYWVCPVLESQIGLFGGKTVSGVILVNAVTGDMAAYDVAEVPE